MTGGSGAADNVADPLIGRVVADRYRIVGLLGRGGMGVVYKVEHVHIGKLMAMKLLHGELARDRSTVKRFQREAETVSHLSHTHTVQVFDFGRSEGMMYLVMEYLEGDDLGDVIRAEGSLSFERAARLAAQVCGSVAEAHGLGIVHRDLKPENIMVVRKDGDEHAKVLDFGLAKLRDQQGGHLSVTRAGAIVGTPYYMPPEQIRGEEVDARGDVYALGAVLYKAITGVPPFVAKTPMGVLTKHLTDALVLPSQRVDFELPQAADYVVAKAMAKEPEGRYQSVLELREALQEFLSGAGISLGDADPRPSQRPTISPGKPSMDRATREEVERYERSIRRRGYALSTLLFLLVVGVGVGGFLLYQKWSARAEIPSVEVEPNNEPMEANALPPDVEVTGLLGRRQSELVGDTDFFRIDATAGLLQVDVEGIPNIDLVVDLYREGQSEALLSVNSEPTGEGERLIGFPVDEKVYLLRVHERWIAGTLPVENVSDRYAIRWQVHPPQEGFEREINDSLGRAETMTIGQSLQAHLGWTGDLDVYCLDAAEGFARISVSAIPRVDIRLRPIERAVSRSHIVDAHGIGEGESVEMAAHDLCVEVSARRVGEAVLSDPEEPYTIRVEAAEPPAPEPEVTPMRRRTPTRMRGGMTR